MPRDICYRYGVHYVKSVRIRSYSGPHFPAFRLNTERYSISPYSVRMRENRDQNNSEYEHFLRSGIVVLFQLRLCQMFVIGTSNKLNDESGEGYEHVTVARELSVMDLELLKFINNQVVPGELFYCL